ncbi:hypothetical protein [Microcoleus sp. herbarium14]
MPIFNRPASERAIGRSPTNRRQLPSADRAQVLRILGDRCGNIF